MWIKGDKKLFAKRAGAYLLDLVAVYFLALATMLLSVGIYGAWKFAGDPAMMSDLATSRNTRIFAQAAHAILYFSYFTIAHWYFGRTIGKLVFGLRVTHKGEDLGLFRSLARSLSYIVSGQLTLAAGFLLPLFRTDGKALHDLMAGTEVVTAQTLEEAAPAPESSESKAA